MLVVELQNPESRKRPGNTWACVLQQAGGTYKGAPQTRSEGRQGQRGPRPLPCRQSTVNTGNRRATGQSRLLIGHFCQDRKPWEGTEHDARSFPAPRFLSGHQVPATNIHALVTGRFLPRPRFGALFAALVPLQCPGKKQSSFTKVSWLQHTSHTVNSHNSPGLRPMRCCDWRISRAIFHKQLSIRQADDGNLDEQPARTSHSGCWISQQSSPPAPPPSQSSSPGAWDIRQRSSSHAAASIPTSPRGDSFICPNRAGPHPRQMLCHQGRHPIRKHRHRHHHHHQHQQKGCQGQESNSLRPGRRHDEDLQAAHARYPSLEAPDQRSSVEGPAVSASYLPQEGPVEGWS